MLVCIPFAWMWMLPIQMRDFSQSLVAVSLFVSNILFWRESGYFAPAAEEKPLLHTWSLAVEEQYYVLFPIFLILAWRFGKNRVFWMIVVMAAISLLLSEWGWRIKATANFYLAPTRAWELFAGSIAAFIVQKQGVQKNNLLATCGLAAIIFSIFFYDETTPFPSMYALVPVLGVVLFALYADKETLAAKVLSTKGFVGIGLISYSAYLWHQPLLAFARIKSQNELSIILIAILVVASLLLAYLSWKYVESPFRNKQKINRKYIFFVSVLSIVLFIIIGIIGHKKDGFPNRLEDYQLDILQWESYPREIAYREGDCFLRPEQSYTEFKSECTITSANTLIWGDSHAAALASGWRESRDVHQLTASMCPPIINSVFPSRQYCEGINRHIFDVISTSNYDTVILHAYWMIYSDEELANLQLTITALNSSSPAWNNITGTTASARKPSISARYFKLIIL
jgi:peptidoglycan/LPS O-acetylase OafA/YrhL